MPLPIFYDIVNYVRVQTVDTRPFFLRWVGPGNEPISRLARMSYLEYEQSSIAGHCVFSGARQSSSEGVQPRENVTFPCTIPSLTHRWEIPSLGIARSLSAADQGVVVPDPPCQFAVTEVIPGTSIASTATVTATTNLNGTNFLCRDGYLELPDLQSYILIVTGEENGNGRHLTTVPFLPMSTIGIFVAIF